MAFRISPERRNRVPDFINIMKYRQKRVTVKRVLSLVLKILIILEKIFSLFKTFPF